MKVGGTLLGRGQRVVPVRALGLELWFVAQLAEQEGYESELVQQAEPLARPSPAVALVVRWRPHTQACPAGDNIQPMLRCNPAGQCTD